MLESLNLSGDSSKLYNTGQAYEKKCTPSAIKKEALMGSDTSNNSTFILQRNVLILAMKIPFLKQKEKIKEPENQAVKLNKNRIKTPPARPIRIWSNNELNKLAHLFKGSVVNVSGWEDQDKQGNRYKDYFKNADEYVVTNYTPSHSASGIAEITLDLEADLDPSLENRFDVVFSHTNLEHIFNIFKAVENHCKMSRDIVIIIVPFIQQQHETEEFKDYWRFTPTCLKELYKMNGLTVVYESFNNEPDKVNYVLSVGSRHPDKWAGKFPEYTELKQICTWVS